MPVFGSSLMFRLPISLFSLPMEVLEFLRLLVFDLVALALRVMLLDDLF